jgi:hypothetical protein
LAPWSDAHLFNVAGHALVGCASAVMGGGRCGPGALSGAAGSFATPFMEGLGFTQGLVAHAVVGGLAPVAGGGNFVNGAVTAAFGYLFNRSKGGRWECPSRKGVCWPDDSIEPSNVLEGAALLPLAPPLGDFFLAPPVPCLAPKQWQRLPAVLI